MRENVLRPYPEFRPRDLAKQLHEAVLRNERLLMVRNLLGPLHRYGRDLDTAVANVEKGIREHNDRKLGHLAALGASGDVSGAGSVFPALPLRGQRAPVPAAIARRVPLLSVEYPKATMNVSAWADEDEGILPAAYQELSMISRHGEFGPPARYPVNAKVPWTVEPLRSPRDIQTAIMATSGLGKVIVWRFDDGAPGWRIPPVGTLFADFGDKRPPFNRLDELRLTESSFDDWIEGRDQSP